MKIKKKGKSVSNYCFFDFFQGHLEALKVTEKAMRYTNRDSLREKSNTLGLRHYRIRISQSE